MTNEMMVIEAFNAACKEFSVDVHIKELETGKYMISEGDKFVSAGFFDEMNKYMRKYTDKISETKSDFRATVRKNLFSLMGC